MMASVKKVMSYSKVFLAFLKIFKLLSIYVKFQVNQQQFFVQKKYVRGNFTANPFSNCEVNRVGGNTLVGIGLIELIEPSDTLNYTTFFKYYILQTILDMFLYFIVYICMKQNLLFKNLSRVLQLFGLVWGCIQCYNIKGYVSLVLLE